MASEGSEEEQIYARSVLAEVDKIPALRKPIKNHNAFAKKHKMVIDKLMSAVFPKALEFNEIKAVTPPFVFDQIAASHRFRSIVENNGGTLGLPYNFDPELLHYAKFIHACRTLLAKFYQRFIPLETPFIFRMKDTETGLDMFYKMTINADFVDIRVKGELKELSDGDIDDLLKNIEDVEVWKRHLPPENFEISGFVICTLVNVTLDELLSQLKNNLLESDALLREDQFEKIRHNVRSLFKVPDLRVGLGVFKEGEGITNFGHWSWRDLICKARIKNIGKEFSGSIYQKVLETGEVVIVENLDEITTPTAIEKAIGETCIKSLIIAPLKYNNNIIGYLELGSCNSKELNALSMTRVDELIPLFSIAIQRSVEERSNRIDAVIMEKCTAIHSSVQWRFQEAAERFLNARDRGHTELEMEPIVFEDVYPLYGMADIRDSSEHRNQAVQADLIAQLKLAQKIILKVKALKSFPILDEINFRVEKLIKSIGKQLRSQDESRVYRLLGTEVEPFFDIVTSEFPEVAQDIARYKKSLDPKLGVIYNRRKSYEQSVNRINSVLSDFLEEKELEAQKMYPHYFEKYKTDGIDYNIYVGKSLSRNGVYNGMCLANIRLWQLITMVEMTQVADKLGPELPIALSTAQLILVHDEPLSIRFRSDEKKFDVDGAYNMRYEIIKKRIDKALIKGSSERATQPGTITVVYTNPEVNKEYMQYCEYLQYRNLIEKNVEQLTLEDAQGVTGLKALRIKVKTDHEEKLGTQEIEEIISILQK
ncbi:MAG: hypothetical protein DHS20C17_01250 [Cyclobacteriaceae bacterium]|nr:MAG: hypothetical protein DHS20C17_01250 [Cyclobacteriaceae bacterium]